MELTFAYLQEKIKEEMKQKDHWEVIDEQTASGAYYNHESQDKNVFHEYPQLSKHMIDSYGLPCLVYRKQLWSESYFAIYIHRGTYYKLSIITKKHDEIQPFKLESFELDAQWQNKETPPNSNKLINAISQTFLEMVKCLPEFRLYIVTGMLEGDGTI